MALSDAVGQGRICAAMQVVDLDELKRNGALWQGRRPVLPAGRVLASGWPVLDELLGGGWPRAALAEVLSDAHQGLSLLLPALNLQAFSTHCVENLAAGFSFGSLTVTVCINESVAPASSTTGT